MKEEERIIQSPEDVLYIGLATAFLAVCVIYEGGVNAARYVRGHKSESQPNTLVEPTIVDES